MRYTIIVLIFIFFASFASSETINLLYNSDYDIKMPCKLNGNNCPSNVNCSLSLYYPNLSLAVYNQPMSYNIGYYNYSINSSILNTIGLYKSDMTCNNSEYNNSYIFYVDVTKKPIYNSDTDYVSETRVISILISLILIFIALGVYFNIKDSQLRYLFFMIAIVFIDALTFFGYTILDNINSTFTNVMYNIYWVMLIITLFVFFLMLIDLMRKYFKWKKAKEINAKDYYGDYSGKTDYDR